VLEGLQGGTDVLAANLGDGLYGVLVSTDTTSSVTMESNSASSLRTGSSQSGVVWSMYGVPS
jgi:hypothetical protein